MREVPEETGVDARPLALTSLGSTPRNAEALATAGRDEELHAQLADARREGCDLDAATPQLALAGLQPTCTRVL
jgi:hypothetical protein